MSVCTKNGVTRHDRAAAAGLTPELLDHLNAAVILEGYELPIAIWLIEERGGGDDKDCIGNRRHDHPTTHIEEEEGGKTSLERDLAVLETRLPKLCSEADARTTRFLEPGQS